MSDEVPICERCDKPFADKCGGTGYILDVETDLVVHCPNIRARSIRERLGPEIGGAKHFRNSPLLQLRPEGGPPESDLTQENLLIKCGWWQLLPHLKWALGLRLKNDAFFFRIIEDQRIKDIFCGDEAYKVRSRESRDDGLSFNGLRDFCESPDLLIIKLGYLGYKNIAAAGALKEALLIRDSANKPTWLVLDPAPDRKWVHSHNADVSEYVHQYYTTLKLGDEDALGMSVDDGSEEEFEEVEVEVEEVEEEDEGEIPADWGLPGDDAPKKRGKW